jgi:cobalt/nickel transport system ATP-binding protein
VSHHLVEIKNLSWTWPDGHRALDRVSLRITHGESVALLGENGAGKSTLLLHLPGILLPQSGSIVIGETPVSRRTLPSIRRSVGFIFQDPDDQLFMPTILEDAAFGPLNTGLERTDALRKAREALVKVGCGRIMDKAPWRLSAGEKRRAAIAAVLSMSPDILVMDEPSSGLDPAGRRLLIGLLKEFEHTRIIATHDLSLAEEVCPRAVVLHAGRIAADGPIRKILRDKALLRRSGLA